MTDIHADPRDWPEDFAHENGNYFCPCTTCGKAFKGHKRRTTCKLCAFPKPDTTSNGARWIDEANFGEFE